MNSYESESYTMVMIEQHLLNARSELKAAERRLGRRGELSEGIRAVAEKLDDTLALARRAKRIMFHEWQKAEAAQLAA